jgi:hypothetical protein
MPDSFLSKSLSAPPTMAAPPISRMPILSGKTHSVNTRRQSGAPPGEDRLARPPWMMDFMIVGIAPASGSMPSACAGPPSIKKEYTNPCSRANEGETPGRGRMPDEASSPVPCPGRVGRQGGGLLSDGPDGPVFPQVFASAVSMARRARSSASRFSPTRMLSKSPRSALRA